MFPCEECGLDRDAVEERNAILERIVLRVNDGYIDDAEGRRWLADEIERERVEWVRWKAANRIKELEAIGKLREEEARIQSKRLREYAEKIEALEKQLYGKSPTFATPRFQEEAH